MDNRFFYSLRFAMEPGRHEQYHFEQLLDFCKAARIDDVMFFINGEELNRGHITPQEAASWMDMIARGKALLEPLGITTSINPWTTLLHADRGRALRAGQNFTPMVDPVGNAATAVACPLCPQWREYIAGIYALYAGLQPEILWVEDDFRLHNHGPLLWGGCFCDLHMAEYSRRAGHPLCREEFLEGVLRPGEPHPYRKIWLDVSRDTMVANARIIGRAVRGASPRTRVGLMSSYPKVHCAEGRDWHGILAGLACGCAMVSRPHLPAYPEVTPQEYLQGLAAHSLTAAAMLPEGTAIYPELESFPHSRFSKSAAFTGFQLETSLALGAGGITLNIFDMMGNGILAQEGYQHVLAQAKGFLNAVAALGLGPRQRRGIQALASSASSYTLHTVTGAGMEELYPAEDFWPRLLSAMGIANTTCPSGLPAGQTVAVSGQYFRNLTESELAGLFAGNFVLMDGEAAHTLLDMGLGRLAGLKGAAWHAMESGLQAYEQACGGSHAGVRDARVSAQASVGDYLEISWEGGVKLLSQVINTQGQPVGPGMAVYCDRVMVLPYGRFGSIQGHLTPVRQSMLQAVIGQIGSRHERPAYAPGQPNLLVNHFGLPDGGALMLTNFSLDATGPIRIRMPSAPGRGILEINRGSPTPAPSDAAVDGCWIVLESGLGALATRVLLIGADGK